MNLTAVPVMRTDHWVAVPAAVRCLQGSAARHSFRLRMSTGWGLAGRLSTALNIQRSPRCGRLDVAD